MVGCSPDVSTRNIHHKEAPGAPGGLLLVTRSVRTSSHDFRRAAAASMRRAGMDLGHVMRLLGHSTPTMTLRYSEAGENEAALRAWQRSVGDAPAAGRRAAR